jgi:hypothetical protein
MFENTPVPDRVDEDVTEAARAVASLRSEGTVVPLRLNEGVAMGAGFIGVPRWDVDLLGEVGGEKLNERLRSRVQSCVVK